jgi:hypothetical protein
MASLGKYGHLIEGVVEQDPLTDRYVIREEQPDGTVKVFDVQAALGELAGQDVRLTLASLGQLQELAEQVEKQGGGQVFGVKPD